MAIQMKEIRDSEWSAFCENFVRENGDSVVTVSQTDRNGITREMAREVPLRGMRLEKDPCNDIIILELGDLETQEIRVIEPIHVQIKQAHDGRKLLHLEAENGITLVHFHSGRMAL